MNKEVSIHQNLQFNSLGLTGVYTDKIHLSESSKALHDLVIIEILDQDESKNKVGNILIPEKSTQNMDMLKGRVVAVGPKAKRKNLNIDDIILYDKWSAFYKPPETTGTYVITRCENIICKIKN